MPVTLDDRDGFEVSSLVYRKWAESYDLLKVVRSEKPDWKIDPDWKESHEHRLKHHIALEAKWKTLLDKFVQQLPKLI